MRILFSSLLGICAALATVGGQAWEGSRALRPVHYDLAIDVDIPGRQIEATARIRLRNEQDRPVDEVSLLLYRLMRVREVRGGDGRILPYQQAVTAFEDFAKLQANHVRIRLDSPLAPGAETVVGVRYGGYLLGYAETGMLYVKDHVDSAYTLLRPDAFAYPEVGYPSFAVNRRSVLPSYDYVASVKVPKGYTVANGGALVERREEGSSVTFVYRSVKPSWRMDFAVAPFRIARRDALTVFYLPEDSVGARRILGAMQRTLALYTQWFGPLEGDSPFAVIEIPDGWGSQADVTSLLQSAAAFRDVRRESELYHEISHLWNVPDADRPAPRWNEGLASFLEDVTVDSLSGRATTDSSAMRLVSWLARRLSADSALRTVPPVEFGKREMTDYSYSVGSLMFYALYRLVGHDAFRGLIGQYYRSYRSGGGRTADFVALAKARSPVDLQRFFEDWLYSTRWTAVVARARVPADLYAPYRASKGQEDR
jgi:hypothetical protein